jgi:DNA (cytosine-5)-methyltransferase 1
MTRTSKAPTDREALAAYDGAEARRARRMNAASLIDNATRRGPYSHVSLSQVRRSKLAGIMLALGGTVTPSARDGDQRGQGSVEHMERRMESGHTINLGDQLRLLSTPRATDGTNGGPGQRGSSGDLAMPSAVQAVNFGRFGVSVEHWAGIHGTPPAPTEVGPQGGVKMSPRSPEWMMGLAPGYVTDVLPRNDALRAIGNGVMPQQGYHAIRTLLDMLSGAPLG